MEIEALRLYKVLYDLSANDEVDSVKGILFKTLLKQAGSSYSTSSYGRTLMIQLLYHFGKTCKSHYSLSLKASTIRRRKAEDSLSPSKNLGEFEKAFSDIKEDPEKIVVVLPISKTTTRVDKLLELLYNRAKNFDTYAIYKFIAEAGPKGITYAQISQKYNEKYGPEKHLSSIKIANYCKKMLEKNGFIQYLQAGSETNSVLKGSERPHICRRDHTERAVLHVLP